MNSRRVFRTVIVLFIGLPLMAVSICVSFIWESLKVGWYAGKGFYE